MTDDPVKQALVELQWLVRCRCHLAYTSRNLRDPDCNCDDAEAVEIVANRISAQAAEIERLQAKLATCEKYRDAYAECDRIGTQAVRDLEARAERLEEALLWCSGSADFNEGGVAREGWLKVCAPLLTGGKDE